MTGQEKRPSQWQLVQIESLDGWILEEFDSSGTGNHVTRDIPLELESARAGYPQISIETTHCPGKNAAMAELVIQYSRNSG